jgi:hypothetical protein
MYCLISSVIGGVEVRSPFGNLDRSLCSEVLLVLLGHPGVASWLSHVEHKKFEGGLGHELAPPGVVLRHWSPFDEGRREVEMGQVALKRPAIGHFLAAEHEAQERQFFCILGTVPVQQ